MRIIHDLARCTNSCTYRIKFNVQHDLSSILNIKIRLLRIENTLFEIIRPLLFLINVERLYVYNDSLTKRTIEQLFEIDKRNSQNSCSDVVLIEIKKILVISELQKQLQNVNRLTKSLLTLTKRLEKSYKCHERYLLTYDV